MAQISRRPLKEEINKQVFELLLKVVTQTYSGKQAVKLLDDLLSPTEQVVLAKRLALPFFWIKATAMRRLKRFFM